MALMQISEPGESKAPHKHRYAVGIDLGTTNSLVAAVKDSLPVVLLDKNDTAILPSVVHYQEDKMLVGREAKEKAIGDPLNTIASSKRLIGRGLEDVKTLGDALPYEFASTNSEMPKIKTRQGEISPVEVSAEILKALKLRAEQSFAHELEGAVITVPAYFDEAQRQATKDAAQIAGIKVLRLLSEPTAAAVAYGLDKKPEGIHVVYDLGGGTFDVSILQLTKGVFEVMAIGGDSALGGDDMDHAIADWIIQQAGFPDKLDHSLQRELLKVSREAKEALTDSEQVKLKVQAWSGELTRDQFNQLIEPLVNKTLSACQKAMKDASIDLDEIEDVIMVGGSTRVPLVREKVSGLFKRKLLTNIDPDQVVAIGAALQADVLIGNRSGEDMLLLDVLPLSLGLETMGGLVEKIINRNMTIPVKRGQQFTTYKDGQTGMLIHVVQGERELVSDCRSLARFELTGIPPMKAGAAKILVVFQVDADGLLNVSAMELSTGVEASVTVKPSYGLSEDEITNMLQASFSHAEDDMRARSLAEQKVEAEQLLEILNAALNEDAEKYLSDEECRAIRDRMCVLSDAIKTGEYIIIKDAYTALDEASQTFAQRRMDGNMKAALTGKTVEDVTDAKN